MTRQTVGGQALIEGIMMKTKDKKTITIRMKDGSTKTTSYDIKKNKISQIPFLRGIYSLITSLVEGTKDINYSASFLEDENKESSSSKYIGEVLSVVLSVGMAILLFSVAPSLITNFFDINDKIIFSLVEGTIKIALFLSYIYLISNIDDIKRVFMYHGAEHKCVFAYENDLPLTVENVRKMSRFHPRCGTNFIFIVLMVSIIFNSFIKVEFIYERILIKILILPIITGVSYEIIKLAGKSDNFLVKIISSPGLMLQRLTTKEPDSAQIEVGIIAMKNSLGLE